MIGIVRDFGRIGAIRSLKIFSKLSAINEFDLPLSTTIWVVVVMLFPSAWWVVEDFSLSLKANFSFILSRRRRWIVLVTLSNVYFLGSRSQMTSKILLGGLKKWVRTLWAAYQEINVPHEILSDLKLVATLWYECGNTKKTLQRRIVNLLQ